MDLSLASKVVAAQSHPIASCHLYARVTYAAALAHMGEPLAAPEWGGPVLTRDFGAARDATGPYPLTVLKPGLDLAGGLERLKHAGLVSVVLVPDPLVGPAPAKLAGVFDFCRPFKTHWLVHPGGYAPSKHHRDRIRRAHRRCRIERARLSEHLDRWTELYAGLVADRAVSGAAAFPPGYFTMLAAQPEVLAFAAFVDEALVAMTLWFEHAGVAYNHLTASDAIGRASGAGFALYDAALQHFAGATANLGGGGGWADDPDDGLAAFKRGFANDSVAAHLCGAVLDPSRYAALSAGKADRGFFPAYRG